MYAAATYNSLSDGRRGERIMMLQTGHKNIAVLRRYIREHSVFRENAAAGVGL